METKEYQPFGKEWEREMMKLNKTQLIGLLRGAFRKGIKSNNKENEY